MRTEAMDRAPRTDLPDWSVVRSEAARQALQAAVDAFDMSRQWVGLEAAEHSIWRAILVAYAATGTAPLTADLPAETKLPPDAIEETLRRLRRRDLVVLDSDGRIVGAYPFTNRATEHQVQVGDQSFTAMCAIDALGIGAMLGTDATVRSACEHCSAPIKITTRDKGQAVGTIAPGPVVVWSGIQYADACAATSLCTVQAFFCSDEHLAASREDAAHGFRLSIEEALQVGRAIFGPMLRNPTAAEAHS
jgi:hypothetical protein